VAGPQTYTYKGRSASGKLVKGSLDATSEAAVASRMQAMGLSPVSIAKGSTGSGLQREFSIPGFSNRIKLKDLAVMARQMATMIGAGLSLLRALNILAEQTESKPLARIFGEIRNEVESGVSTSDAFAKHAEVFPPLMISMVRAGEAGGFLEGALESIADNFEKEVKLKGKIKSAMTYPVIVLIMSLISVVAMLIFIVPVFQKMFAGLGGKLPLPTMMLVYMSRSMVWVGPILLVLFIAFAIWWPKNKHTERVRKFLEDCGRQIQPQLLRHDRSGGANPSSPANRWRDLGQLGYRGSA
jgi:type IV pilus assembly protein PilC